jgi:hypothetical protein
MDDAGLHILIAHKLREGCLPRSPVRARVLGGPGKGETCDACGASITKEQLGIEGIPWEQAAEDPCNFTPTASRSGTRSGGSSRVKDRRSNHFVCLMRLSASHAARCVACQGVRSHPVPVALVGECSIPLA